MAEVLVTSFADVEGILQSAVIPKDVSQRFVNGEIREQGQVRYVAFEEERAVGGLVAVLRTSDETLRIADMFVSAQARDKEAVQKALLDRAEATAALFMNGIIVRKGDINGAEVLLPEHGFDLVDETMYVKKT